MAEPVADARADVAHQPRNFAFPKRTFGSKGKTRSFKPGWFDKWTWLDYCETNERVICFTAHVRVKIIFYRVGHNSKREESYVSKGFTNWKDACESFR